ncbi:HET-domain-containing protein [Periconia macrospinosa]|uniref:HET-domain-containing protein n=1 Tax=Periconia macrospinosa TaxID=97972 RepID=A0A2V1E3Q2_9PLEO|nr:HET-domain-containing protein [Periconia macrospinosa]
MHHCIATIKSWLQRCNGQHEGCPSPKPKLPTRLLYITEKIVQLVETESLPYSPYLTLSHCWGNDPANMLKTTTKTLERHRRGIEWGQLPAVFRDALTITKAVGCQWIWIDSLCIVQDDEDDWGKESLEMANVYSNSVLNIAATFSSNSSNTFFRNRCPFDGDGPQLFARLAHWPTHAMITGQFGFLPGRTEPDRIAPLLQRAWVFQERLLAPRTVHIGSSELIWECNSSLMCECGGISATQQGLKPRFADACQGRSSREEVLDLWDRIVEIYSGLRLTKPSDRSNALSGISSQLSSILKCDYLDGIWGIDAARGLLWETNMAPAARVSEDCPSWSWMWRYDLETSRSKVFYKNLHMDPRLRVQFSASRCEDHDGDHSEVVRSSRLHVKGFMLRATLTHRNQKVYSDSSAMSVETWELKIGSSINRWFPDCEASDRLEGLEEVLCVLGGTNKYGFLCGLVVAQLGGEGTLYRRVGQAFLDWETRDDGMFDHGEMMSVELV